MRASRMGDRTGVEESARPLSTYKAIRVKRAQPTLTRWLKRTEERIVGL